MRRRRRPQQRHRYLVTTTTFGRSRHRYNDATTASASLSRRRCRCDVLVTTSSISSLSCDEDAVTTLRCHRPRRLSMSLWRWGCSFDIVVVSTLSPRRRYNVVDSLRHTTSVVRRPTLSSFAVCRHSRNPSSCIRPCDCDVHVGT